MDISLLEYELPPELIAQHPAEPRDSARLLVYRKASGTIEHRAVADLPELVADELVVVNDTRVVPARVRLRRATGGAVEVLLLEAVDENGTWEALARPSGRLRAGKGGGSYVSTASRMGRLRCRRTSESRLPTPADTRPSSPAISAQLPLRLPVCTSRRSSSSACSPRRSRST
jgi:hypothetical protein